MLARAGNAREESHGTLYVKDVTYLPRSEVEFYKKEDIVFRLDQRKAFSRIVFPTMTTNCTRTSYEELKKEVIRIHDSRNA